MSADLLARNCVTALRNLREEKIKKLRLCKPRPPTVMPDGVVVPSSGVEEIALLAVDTNSAIDAFNLAIETVEKEFLKLTSPEEPDQQPQQARKLYG